MVIFCVCFFSESVGLFCFLIFLYKRLRFLIPFFILNVSQGAYINCFIWNVIFANSEIRSITIYIYVLC